ncbi:MAG: T9SS type A sorting domain-containing protein [Chitinophagaceae bacterium]|nr:T9SS type A sorting domain-containing protein [Chitinophagaceae bacterium]
MKQRSILSFVAITLLLLTTTKQLAAQKTFVGNPVDSRTTPGMRTHFSRFSVFTIGSAEITEYAKSKKGKPAEFELQLPGFAHWKFSLTEHDILSKDYTFIVNGVNGSTQYPKPSCITYRGQLTDVPGSRVSLTIDNNVLYGIIRSGNTEYFIEPLNYLDRQAPTGQFVVYDTRDVIPNATLTCGVQESNQRRNSLQRQMAGTNCVQTQVAIASDESMFIRYGSAGAVQTHNIGVMNNVIWDYVNAQFTNNVEFVIVTQNVSTTAATDQLTPAYAGTNSGTVLDNFTLWGNNGNFGTTFDLGQFWTTRNIDNDGLGGGSGTIGLAWVGAVCSPFRYHILEDFAGSIPSGSGFQLRVLTAHEIGHNFDCNHDGGNGFIMSPSVGNTATWSAASITALDNIVGIETAPAGCLSYCDQAGVPISGFLGRPEAICTGGTSQLTDHTQRGPTSWSWTMTGGTPATSTSRNPTVSYATSGVKAITLTATNAMGTGTPYTRAFLVSDAGVSACSNSGAVVSDAGVKSFTLSNINRVSGGSATDGNKYMDFSCSDITSLVANTSYNVSAQVGNSATSQANVVQLFIDYNNDGDFADANEAVYSSPMCYIGTHTFSFTTIASPPITNQFLRVRVIAKDCVGGVNSCYNVTNGQVEDYSAFFASGLLLPVSLISFEGYHYNGNNTLNWKTAGEKENSHFEIERSIDGTNFDAVGRVEGNLNTTSVKLYTFTDLLAGLQRVEKYYYRLKIVSVTGEKEYSKTITISTPQQNDLVMHVQPNPFSGSLTATVQLKNANTLNMQLIDMSGRVLYQDERRLPAGTHTLSYNNFEKLPKGTYIIKLMHPGETVSRLVEKR